MTDGHPRSKRVRRLMKVRVILGAEPLLNDGAVERAMNDPQLIQRFTHGQFNPAPYLPALVNIGSFSSLVSFLGMTHGFKDL